MREKINFYTTEHNTNKYIDALDEIVDNYNNTVQSRTQKKPIDIYLHNAIPKPIDLTLPSNDVKFKINDYVRIATNMGVFEKKTATNNWSYDVYKIIKIDNSIFPIVYYLENDKGKKIQTLFYGQELQKTLVPNFKRTIK